jgi:hypothetical protein
VLAGHSGGAAVRPEVWVELGSHDEVVRLAEQLSAQGWPRVDIYAYWADGGPAFTGGGP